MVHTVDKELNAYIKRLNISQKKSLLDVIKSFLQPAEQNKTISIEQYNKEIEDSETEIERGDSYTHDEVIDMSKKWTSDK